MCFNPRTHEGCDRDIFFLIFFLMGFNPRTHEGCDSLIVLASLIFCLFQSTHPRGVRRIKPCFVEREQRFQSTHPRGVRLSSHELTFVRQKFQSTHPRGVRLIAPIPVIAEPIVSIHAPTRGATITYRQGTCTHEFQSTHPRGVRPSRT